MKLLLKSKLRPIFRRLKIKRFCRLGFNDLDLKLEKYLDFNNGVFIEAGANNGLSQSNTYYLESIKGWKGILIEPVPHLFEMCVNSRPNSKVYNAALVSSDFEESEIKLVFAGLMTMPTDLEISSDEMKERLAYAEKCQKGLKPYEFSAPARTLTDIINESGHEKIDFLSLDLEGYELQALLGLDFAKYKPRFILIEVRDEEKIDLLLCNNYIKLDKLTHRDGFSDILYGLK